MPNSEGTQLVVPHRQLPARTRGRWVAALVAAVAGALLVAAPASYADESPAPAPTPKDAVTWGTGPTDNDVGTGRPNFSYEAQPGGTLRDSIDVINRSDRALQLTIYASDAFTTSSGVLDLLPADQEPVGVGTWIALDDDALRVPAGTTVSVPFTLTVPENATPGDHTGGIVTSLVTEETDGQVSVDRRIGSRVLVRVAGELRPQLSVTDVQASYDGTVSPVSPGTAHVTYTVTNTGNVRLAAHQTVTAAGPFGLLGSSVTPADLPELLPGSSRTLTADVDGVWPTVRITADVALQPYVTNAELAVDAATATGASALWAIPWGQLLVLAVVALLVWGALLLRRRRRAAVEAQVAAAVAEALRKGETAST
jgi:hypothetical protein